MGSRYQRRSRDAENAENLDLSNLVPNRVVPDQFGENDYAMPLASLMGWGLMGWGLVDCDPGLTRERCCWCQRRLGRIHGAGIKAPGSISQLPFGWSGPCSSLLSRVRCRRLRPAASHMPHRKGLAARLPVDHLRPVQQQAHLPIVKTSRHTTPHLGFRTEGNRREA